MKKIDAGQTIGILANIGVLIGILFLAFELRQNRQMMYAQTRNAISDTLVNLLALEATTPELMVAAAKREAGESLTPAEKLMNENIDTAFWRFRENLYYQYKIGLFEESEYVGSQAVWLQRLNTNEIFRQDWCRRRNIYSAAFRSEIDGLLATPCE